MPATHEVLSPLPGTFYRRSAPDAPPFKAEGDTVAVGDVIGLVEVMKQFSEVTADVAGRLRGFAVENGEPVDPGQALAVIETA
ncbi:MULTISPECIES: acetyl-CoA carboxylase [Delftia]|jgi:biotin carboxyl carrier protein|uniref:Biotin carboxyl carrier protein of acetyl-CoA carboxylase n=4 Tax=Pseudomonadati TaxID=3379134 RepID=A9BP89_DELAS|nr:MULTISPECIES: acetyl-CoA carboxylase [Delftia]MCP4019494.1 biotin carboxyl carrier domain-containing protein [Delftia sp.]OLE92588.1 MAG: acetyl-CoA carboxylase biotin carboxyl carrier protein subunit [Delftia sp. 13_1_40CM_3_66_6]PIF35444.1 biotin-dependent enzyme [Burkholderiales bacterium 23]ABX32653.1 biotin/lipoyl attachment domain-containing protein [Delftia acidovorans SPH-1]AEF87050.1 biotin/lipoyl attachment domain-containing protein [Delftia sp. Cs1-4]